MESKVAGRVYAVIGGKGDAARVIRVILTDSSGKRETQIDVNKHSHKGLMLHVHHGYEHEEYDDPHSDAAPSTEERDLVDRILTLWDRHKQKTGR